MTFRSWNDFHNFIKEVKLFTRYIYSKDVNEFIENISKCLPDRAKTLTTGGVFYRGQIGYTEHEHEDELIPIGYSSSRMKPIHGKAKEGRANPKGIAYLYLANDENTALSELRPHLGQYISSAQFRVKRDLRIVDCYSATEHYTLAKCFFQPPRSQDEINNAIWSLINDCFTKPITNQDESFDYVPTQILAELFKSKGFDGICYKSSMGAGYNYILFNLNDAELINCTVMETTEINYKFKECANRYFVQSAYTSEG